jgi:diguanylate cyclase (GGDEF)-like protein
MSLQARLVAFFGGLLIVALGGVLFAVNLVNSRSARENVDEELVLGEKVFQELVRQNNRQLTQAAEVLSLDFAFRQAVATGDVQTTESVLANHGARINADLAILIGLDDKVIADTANRERIGKPFPFRFVLDTAEKEGGAGRLVVDGGNLYQLVVVPVRAPEPIAWAAFGFRVHERLARDLRSLTRLDLSFFSFGNGDGGTHVLASALPADVQQAEAAAVAAEPAPKRHMFTLETSRGEYRTLLVPLAQQGGSVLAATLARSLDEALATYHRLAAILLAIGAIALIFSVAGGVAIARGITRPIHDLAEASRRIEDGDFTQAVEVKGKDEVGDLARRFNLMREGLAAREGQIVRLAYRDALTDLPNRRLFNDRLGVALETCRRSGTALTVLMMDLDRFKQINDTLGHQTGDLVLQQVAGRLRAIFRKSDTVGRLGGDEFAMLLTNTAEEEAEYTAAKIVEALEEPFKIGEHTLDVRASIGVAGYPAQGEDAETLMRRADAAMYAAKRGNRGYALYEPSLETRHAGELSLLSDLRRAIERNELELAYQPKIELHGSTVAGAEALLRWQHPERGAIPPAHFIPFAEQTGFIRSLTRWVIEAAARQSAAWMAAGLRIPLAVNISVQDLLDPVMPEFLLSVLAKNGVQPSMIQLEITESGVMQDAGAAIAVLKRLRELGIDTAIDDFGTGYSSLAYVKQLSVGELKIDRSFVRNLVRDTKDRAIVLSTIELGHNLDLRVVAEGVEDPASVEVLRKLGCDLVQGYVFARPMAEPEFRRWVRERDGQGVRQPA